MQNYFTWIDGRLSKVPVFARNYGAILIAIILAALFLLFRPLIQDDAWAVSFVVSKIKSGDPFKIGLIDAFDKLSYRTYYNWFNFIPLELSVRTFGANLFGARFHIWLYASLIFVTLPFFINSIFKIKAAYIIPVILVFIPAFNMHFWNRSEIPALFFSLTSVFFINSKQKHAVFISIVFFLISFDIHPTSAFLGFPFIVFRLQLHKLNTWIQIGLAGLLGSLIIISSKLQFYSYAVDNVDFVLKCLHLKGGSDHYSPVFYLFTHDFYHTEKARLFPFFIGFLPIFVLFFLNIKRILSLPDGKYFLKVFIGNILLSILLVDTLGNGYQLYMVMCFLLFSIYVLKSVVPSFENNLIFFVFLVILCDNIIISAKQLFEYVETKPRSDQYYTKVEKILSEENYSLIGARPQYFFLTNRLNKKLDFYFSIFLDADRKKTNILDELEAKKYDLLILDDGFEQTIITEKKNAPGLHWSFYYANLPTVSQLEYDTYMNSHYVVKMADTDPIGQKTRFYIRKK